MNEQLLKKSDADVLSSRRRLRKILKGVGWHPHQRETSARTVNARLSYLISGSGSWHHREAFAAENIKYPPLGLRARETFELDL